MKVVVISQYWYPENGVPQRRWSWLSQILSENGHEVVAIAPPPHYQRQISFKEWLTRRDIFGSTKPSVGPSGETIFRCGYIPGGESLTLKALNQATVAASTLLLVFRLRSWLKEYNPDIVIGTVPALPTAPVTTVVARLLGIPYGIDLRDAWPDLLDESRSWNNALGRPSLRELVLKHGPLQIASSITKLTLNLSLRNASAISVTSSFLRRELSTRYKMLRHSEDDIALIRNTFPSETNYEKSCCIAERLDELNVLYAGTIGRSQHLQNAIDAAIISRDQGLKVNLRFIGAGAAKQAVISHAKDAGVSIQIFNNQNANELKTHYAWAHTALVHLAPWPALARCVPSKTYELMSAGIHISAVVSGETAMLVNENRGGHVVPPQDPSALSAVWRQLSDNPHLLNTPDDGKEWVNYVRETEAPKSLLYFIRKVEQNGKL